MTTDTTVLDGLDFPTPRLAVADDVADLLFREARTAAAFTPSRNAAATRDWRNRGTSGPLMATKTKAGRKIPIVATTAPGAPART